MPGSWGHRMGMDHEEERRKVARRGTAWEENATAEAGAGGGVSQKSGGQEDLLAPTTPRSKRPSVPLQERLLNALNNATAAEKAACSRAAQGAGQEESPRTAAGAGVHGPQDHSCGLGVTQSFQCSREGEGGYSSLLSTPVAGRLSDRRIRGELKRLLLVVGGSSVGSGVAGEGARGRGKQEKIPV
ncbi:unnamed protein product [Discosporangium mesarthrocarpum]